MNARDHRGFTLAEANGLMVIGMALFLTLGATFQSRGFVSGILITEYLLIAAPVLLFAVVRKKDLVSTFRLRPIRWNETLRIVTMSLFLVPTILAANVLMMALLSAFGKVFTQQMPTADSLGTFLLLFFVMAVTPAICEEIFFRGMMLDAYERATGPCMGALLSALFFALFHFNPQNLLGPLILGMVFAYLVQLTGSIWPAIIAHLTNNGVSVIMGYLGTVFSDPELMAAVDPDAYLQPGMLFYMGLIFALMAGVGMFVVVYQIKRLRSGRATFEPNTTLRIGGKVYRIIARRPGYLVVMNDAIDTVVLSAEETMAHFYRLSTGDLKKMHYSAESPLWYRCRKPGPAVVGFALFVTTFYAVIVRWQWQLLGL
jgi:membrane protease YdiL (CAAX protease family)